MLDCLPKPPVRSVLEAVREATRPLHASLGSSPAMSRLFASDYTLSEYRLHISRLYGFYEPLDSAAYIAANAEGCESFLGARFVFVDVQRNGSADGAYKTRDLPKQWGIPINGNLSFHERHIVYATDERVGFNPSKAPFTHTSPPVGSAPGKSRQRKSPSNLRYAPRPAILRQSRKNDPPECP